VLPPAKDNSALRKRHQSRSPEKESREGKNAGTFSSQATGIYSKGDRSIMADITNKVINKRTRTAEKLIDGTTGFAKSLKKIKEASEKAISEMNNNDSDAENQGPEAPETTTTTESSEETSEDELSSQATEKTKKTAAQKDDRSESTTLSK
jgi:hypothetical protein